MSAIITGTDTCTDCGLTNIATYPGYSVCWACYDANHRKRSLMAWEVAELLTELIEIEQWAPEEERHPSAEALNPKGITSPDREYQADTFTVTDKAGHTYHVAVTLATT